MASITPSVSGSGTGVGNLTYGQIYNLALNAGFTGSSANTITAIALAESGGNPYAINPADPQGSYGLTQINGAAHGLSTALSAFGNPQQAMNLAYSISNGGTNFTPWSTYTTTNPTLSYKRFLGNGATSTLSASTSGTNPPTASSILGNLLTNNGTTPLWTTQTSINPYAVASGVQSVASMGMALASGGAAISNAATPAAVATSVENSVSSTISSAISSTETWLASIGGDVGIALLAVALLLIAVWPSGRATVVEMVRGE